MGAYLSKPIRDKESCDESLEQLTYGASSMQGWRGTQEVAIFEAEKNFVEFLGHCWRENNKRVN